MSWGGSTAAETCRSDSRVKCAALLDAAIDTRWTPHAELGRTGLQKPFLAMNRTVLDKGLEDLSPGNQTLYTLARQNATWLKIKNSGHFTFRDFAWTGELTSDSRQAAVAMNAC